MDTCIARIPGWPILVLQLEAARSRSDWLQQLQLAQNKDILPQLKQKRSETPHRRTAPSIHGHQRVHQRAQPGRCPCSSALDLWCCSAAASTAASGAATREDAECSDLDQLRKGMRSKNCIKILSKGTVLDSTARNLVLTLGTRFQVVVGGLDRRMEEAGDGKTNP